MTRPGARESRLECVVPSAEDREKIRSAAAETKMSVRRFVGRAAVEKASGPGLELARLEHVVGIQQRVAEIQEHLTDSGLDLVHELRGLRRDLARFSSETFGHHDKSHSRLARGLDAIAETRRMLDAALAGNLRTQEMLLGAGALVAAQVQRNGAMLEHLAAAGGGGSCQGCAALADAVARLEALAERMDAAPQAPRSMAGTDAPGRGDGASLGNGVG